MPQQVDSLHLSGVIASQRGDYEAAVGLIGRALALNNAAPQFHNNIGVAYRALKQFDNAARHFRRAAALKLDYAEAHHNIGAVCQDQGKLDEAVAAFQQALALKPDYAKAHYSLGFIYQAQKKWDEAVARYGQALAFNPGYVDALNNLGLVLKEQGKLSEAAAHHERALAINPNHAGAHYNLGIVREEQGCLDDALASYARAQDIAPEDSDLHWNEALIRLLRGDYVRGWEKYEWRFKRAKTPPPYPGKPVWDGSDPAGKTLLLYAEQGYGDTIQFMRYAALLKKMGAKVIAACQPGLARLIATATGVDQTMTWGDAAPAFDFYAPLLSMPKFAGTTIESVPADVPYLGAQADLAETWRAKLKASGLNVGLVWRGNPDNTINHKKSIPVEALAPLMGVPGVNWFIIQADATPEDVAALARHGRIEVCGPALTDWADTAALISVLDLVISVDTGVAHLAGALGKPLWVPLSYIPDWRWLLDRSDSPWYPSAKLFRQQTFGDWPAVVARMQSELTARVRQI